MTQPTQSLARKPRNLDEAFAMWRESQGLPPAAPKTEPTAETEDYTWLYGPSNQPRRWRWRSYKRRAYHQ
jgi:hypothetical protein